MFTKKFPANAYMPKVKKGNSSAKHVQSKHQRHQNYVVDIVVMSSLPTANTFYTLPRCPHFQILEDKCPLGHNKLVEKIHRM